MEPCVYYKSTNPECFTVNLPKFKITSMSFWSVCKETSYQLQSMLNHSDFLTKHVIFNEEHHSKWISCVPLNLE